MNDFLYRGLIKDFNIRFAYAHTTKVSNDLVKTHNACPLVSHILSRAATAGVLCSPTLGEGERYAFTVNYPGPIGKVIIDAGAEAASGSRCARRSSICPDQHERHSTLAGVLGRL